jgi:L-serine deaminase
MHAKNDIAGLAALSICESLLLALNDRNILPEREILGILKDAATAHELASEGEDGKMHGAVAALINGILAGGNSVRRR